MQPFIAGLLLLNESPQGGTDTDKQNSSAQLTCVCLSLSHLTASHGTKGLEIYITYPSKFVYQSENQILFSENDLKKVDNGGKFDAEGNLLDEFIQSQEHKQTRTSSPDSILSKALNNRFVPKVNTYDAYENDIASVRIFFDSHSIVEYLRKRTMTW